MRTLKKWTEAMMGTMSPHRLSFAMMLCAAVAVCCLPARGAGQPAAKKRALVVWGGWEGHQPRQTSEIFVPWLKEKGFEVEVANTLEVYADPVKMKDLALIVQAWTMGQITPAQEKGLLGAVRNGVGLAGWHGGLADSFRANPEYEFMVGGSWAAHPGNTVDYQVRITRRDDPITRGLTDFAMRSEQYYMLIDPNVEVLATTAFVGAAAKAAPWIEGAVMPVVWRKLYGKGRVFNTTLGHVASDFDVPQARELVQRGPRRGSRRRSPADQPLREVRSANDSSIQLC